MANPLEIAGGPPQAPLPDNPQNGLQQGQPSQGAPGQPMPPPPSHAQTLAALRHFDAIKGELHRILKDPAVGKSDMKSRIIDGVTKLVSERMISPAQAVMQLSQVPEDPIKQRQWLQTMMAQTVTAENAILDHYGQGNASLGDVQGHVSSMDHGSGDDHMDHMAALQQNYGGAR